MPITPERWISNLREVATSMANRRMQEEKWPTGVWEIWEDPDEIINDWDAYVLDGFIEAFSTICSPKQKAAAQQFLDAVEDFCASPSLRLEAAQLLADPDWEKVRQSAEGFLQAFSEKWPPAGMEDRARELVDEWMRVIAKRNAMAKTNAGS